MTFTGGVVFYQMFAKAEKRMDLFVAVVLIN